MSVKRINGLQLEKMVRNGFANLEASEEEVNSLNVFPVADGDTGTNMCLTLSNGIRHAKSHVEAGLYLKELSEGMLLGARGNSGVILSQLFKGMSTELTRQTMVGPGELRNALIRSYKTAYSAVVEPVEGTILTVAREGIEHIRGQISRSTCVDNLLSMYIAEMRKTLSYTPEMLGVLKEAGVIDSGALGYILICEGMLKYLYGEEIRPDEQKKRRVEIPVSGNTESASFDENSIFEDGYCMEFILQLMKGEAYNQRFRLPAYIDDLKAYGNSLAVIQEGMRVKVHIHTRKPAKVITLSQEYGEFLNFKLENMQLQHNEHLQQKALSSSQKALQTVALVNGQGVGSAFRDLGCSVLIEGGTTMNPSAQDFLNAYKKLRADCIAVLPNNPNAIPAAEQAAGLYEGSAKIVVLQSKSMMEGYFALAMDVADSTDASYRLTQMKNGITDVVSLLQTQATRDFSGEDLSCHAGDQIVLMGEKLLSKGSDPAQAILSAFEKVSGIEDKESCLLFRGENVSEQEEEALLNAIGEKYPLLEVTTEEGGQGLYHWLIGLT